jgi:hypothetical protein
VARATGGGTSLEHVAQLVGGGIIAIVIIGAVLLGILSLAGGGAGAVTPNDIEPMSFLIVTLIAASAGLGLVGLVLHPD